MKENGVSYNYSVYGMNLKSPIPLPGLPQATAKPDVNIRFGKISDRLLARKLPSLKQFNKMTSVIKVSPQAMFFQWQTIGKVLIENGTDVVIESKEGTEKEDILPFLTGLILGVLLHQRGSFVIHASAVRINNQVIAFMGEKGYGKSTLAAHLQVRGHDLISDDLVPITFADGEIYTTPGFPRIKLHEDSINAAGLNPEKYPLIHRLWRKRSFECIQSFSPSPVRINAFCVLGSGEKVEISKLPPIESFVEIAKNTYLKLYLDALNYRTEQFENCRRIIEKIPVVKLERPPSFELMNTVIEALEEFALEIGISKENARAA